MVRGSEKSSAYRHRSHGQAAGLKQSFNKKQYISRRINKVQLKGMYDKIEGEQHNIPARAGLYCRGFDEESRGVL